MDRRVSVAVVVLAVVLLAGCSAILGGDVGDGGADEPAEFDYPEGYSADGIDDGERAVETYEAALFEAGNYTGEYTYFVVTDGTLTSIGVDYVVDFEAEHGLQRVIVDAPDTHTMTESYYEEGKLYQRSVDADDESTVTVSEEPFARTDLTAAEAVEPLLSNATGYNVSISEVDGVRVARYETDDVTGAGQFLGVEDTEIVSSFEANITVDQRGLVRTAEYSITYVFQGEDRSVSMTFEVTDVGETTVERPEWADEA